MGVRDRTKHLFPRSRIDSSQMSTPEAALALQQNEIRGHLSPLLEKGGSILPLTDMRVARLLRDCDNVQKHSAALASVLKIEVLQLTGDVKAIEYWANNAARLGTGVHASVSLSLAYSNLGYITKSSSVFADVSDVKYGQVNTLLGHGVACGAFSETVKAAAALERAGGSVERRDAVMQAESIVEALRRLDVPESDVRAVMDEAGSLMRDRKLLWLNEGPEVIVANASEPAFVALNYRLTVSAAIAAEMTWELADRLSEIGVMPPGVTVGFLGVSEGAR